jgi:hypothetical protein
MTDATKRPILRWIHLVFGIPIVGYIYSPFEDILPLFIQLEYAQDESTAPRLRGESTL